MTLKSRRHVLALATALAAAICSSTAAAQGVQERRSSASSGTVTGSGTPRTQKEPYTGRTRTQTPPPRTQRCPASDTGCTFDNAVERMREIIDDTAVEHFSDEDAYTPGSVRQRVQQFKRRFQECIECGVDAIQDGFDRINVDGAPRSDPINR
jgi:hypothetical protein